LSSPDKNDNWGEFLNFYFILENLGKSSFELIKVFNLLIISEVKLRKYLKSDEFGDLASKAKSARAEAGRSDGRVPDQSVDEDDRTPYNKTPHDRTPEPSSDPEIVDADPAIASADPDVDSKPFKTTLQ